MNRLKDKVAIITGAGRGIGREICLYLASEGARIVVNDLGGDRDGSGEGKVADQVVDEIKALGGNAAANYDSVGTVEGGQNIFNTALDAFGRADFLVNNAGVLRDRTLYNMEESDWDVIMEVHLKGHYNCTRPLVRYIRDNNVSGCRIINMSSVSGLFGNFGQVNYGAAKEGIAGFTRSLALEVAKYKCTVNTISPGAATRLTIDLMEAAGRKYDENRNIIPQEKDALTCDKAKSATIFKMYRDLCTQDEYYIQLRKKWRLNETAISKSQGSQITATV